MPGFNVQVNLNKSPSQDMNRIIKRSMQLTQMELLGNTKRNSPVDEGKLQGSWFPVYNNQTLKRGIRSSAKYAEWVNDGTGIYGPRGQIIRPKTARLLGPFKYKGRMIAVPWIRGMKPRRYVERSIRQTQSRTEEFVIRAVMETEGST